MNKKTLSISGPDLRRALLPALQTGLPESIDFFKVSPDNRVGVGGPLGKQFRGLTERHRHRIPHH